MRVFNAADNNQLSAEELWFDNMDIDEQGQLTQEPPSTQLTQASLSTHAVIDKLKAEPFLLAEFSSNDLMALQACIEPLKALNIIKINYPYLKTLGFKISHILRLTIESNWLSKLQTIVNYAHTLVDNFSSEDILEIIAPDDGCINLEFLAKNHVKLNKYLKLSAMQIIYLLTKVMRSGFILTELLDNNILIKLSASSSEEMVDFIILMQRLDKPVVELIDDLHCVAGFYVISLQIVNEIFYLAKTYYHTFLHAVRYMHEDRNLLNNLPLSMAVCETTNVFAINPINPVIFSSSSSSNQTREIENLFQLQSPSLASEDFMQKLDGLDDDLSQLDAASLEGTLDSFDALPEFSNVTPMLEFINDYPWFEELKDINLPTLGASGSFRLKIG